MKSEPTTVLVTGGSRGIGAAACRALAERGHAVAINYTRDAAAAEALANELRARGAKALAVQADVADAAQVAALFARVDRELPPLAGLAVPAGSVELDAWALAPARGKGLFGKQGGWPLVAAWLSQRFDHALSVVFSDNEPGQAHARSIGGTWIGRTYLPSRDIPGFRDGEVDVYVHELARYRPSQGTSP